jgi:hypothetical protein
MPVADLFEVNDNDSVWDAWLTMISLLDMLVIANASTSTTTLRKHETRWLKFMPSPSFM